ncbi:hypothetical protein LPW26_03710 [Rhodopseudomonas sp. HC1]|uniref:hypothetical protein n=1 Tax=Rhodopseudomonas infernalis TaxID=2897386 RepID=UPI001EE7A269|nr:hypothetical protein [Rhodopseudomonas infernalis]MCG6203732.1 hypothetical protein [Rhodopseudomonas infernalis]
MLRKAFMKVFSAHPVETIAACTGLFMILLGVALGTQSGWIWFWGQISAICGASLATLAVVWTVRQRAAEARTAAHLNVLARQLETSISQIHKSIKGGRDESLPSAVYLAQIEQCIDNLIGVTHEIGEITGRQLPFDVIEMLTARDTLQIEARITDTTAPERKLATETENCPACKKAVEFQIGSLPGDSAKPTCPHCGQRFHAHRSTSGNIFLRMPGASQFTRAVSVNCPVCASKIPANIDQGKQHAETRFCFSCGAKVSIDPQAQQCTLVGKQDRLPGAVNSAGTLVCEKCGDPAQVLTSNSAGTYGICRKDDGLVFLAANSAAPPRSDAAE